MIKKTEGTETLPIIHNALTGAQPAPAAPKRRGRPPKSASAAAQKPEAAKAEPAVTVPVRSEPVRPEPVGTEAPKEPAAPPAPQPAEPAPQTAPKSQARISPAAQWGIKKFHRSKLPPFAPDPNAGPVRIIPLGGLEEIGKNMTIIEYGDEAIMVDCGQAFPNDDEVFGVDVVIPETGYVEQIKDKLRGIVITHGHEDHIGCLPYLLKDYAFPVFGTKLVIGLVTEKMREHNLMERTRLFGTIKPEDVISFGQISVEFINCNHSIPDSVSLAIHTPAGVIIHTGDFKIDFTPIKGSIMDLGRLNELGNQGVLLLMSDSTNSERPGFTPTERKVGHSFNTLFETAAKSRIIVATFASNIHRIQQIVDCAEKFGRKVAVSGRSMINTFNIAMELGYLTIPDGILIDIEEIENYLPEQLVLVTTGSQGEPMSALSRMANADHRKVEVGPGDFIIISATPIPGNERMVNRVVNRLLKLGAEVIYEKMYETHVSGHACQEEQKLILALTKPKYFMPVHGEYKHLKRHAETAQSIGIPRSNIVIAEIGNIVEVTQDSLSIIGSVPCGRVYVDGLSIGDVGTMVLRDRKMLSQDGILVITAVISSDGPRLTLGPEIISRGFVFVKESEQLMQNLTQEVLRIIDELIKRSVTDVNIYRSEIRDALSKRIYMLMKRSPIIVAQILEE